MYAQSVLGAVPAEKLGLTLIHEHLLFDFGVCLTQPTTPAEQRIVGQPVHIEALGILRFNPCLLMDNLVNRDVSLAADELEDFVAVGGQTLVDPTNASIGRNPKALQEIARRTGVNIIMGSGYYYQIALDETFAKRSTDDIANEIVRDIFEGVGNTTVPAGLIGEIGTSAPITPSEITSLKAAARAQAQTGAPLMVHLDGWGREGHRVLDLIVAEGGDPNRTILCHMNPSWFDLAYQTSLAERGAYLEYDMLGINHFYPPDRSSPDELVAIQAISQLIQLGYLGKLLISQDVYLKMMFQRFGGYGYVHILQNLQPLFRASGITTEHTNTMMVENPRNLLAFMPSVLR